MTTRGGFEWGFAWCVLIIAISVLTLVSGVVLLDDSVGAILMFAGAASAALGVAGVAVRQASLALLGMLGSACGGMAAASLMEAEAPWASPVLTAGLLGLVGLGLLGAFWTRMDRQEGGRGGGGSESLLHELRETAMLSDTAKRIIYRDRELSLIRRTIEEDIERGDFNAGLVLCGDMDRLFGYSEEAEQLRQRVLLARNSQLAVRIGEDVAGVDHLLDSGRIDEAESAALRLQRMYPDSPSLHGLDARVRGRFMRAAERGEVESAMELLRQLDRQLRSDEAAEIHDAAAGVIAQHRDALSVRFKMAVSDHRWAEAIEAGTQIIADFPNDRMATEVREMLERLRERAATEAEESAT